MKHLITALFACLIAASSDAAEEPNGPLTNPLIDYAAHREAVRRVEPIRADRRLTEAQFLAKMQEPGVVVLDARSGPMFKRLHLKGAVNLSYPDFSAEALAKVIPAKDTPVLIYCNNNFVGAPEVMVTKTVSVALNVNTFVALHAYGYTNVYELGPLLDVKTTVLPLAGTDVRPWGDLIVHEWGTFTSVHASDGRLLTGLEREEHALPGFVRSHAGFAPANKGWSRPVKNVTIKMETPVLYFYAPRETAVDVRVGFRGGSISQWYPERADGERWATPSMSIDVARAMPAVDFAGGRFEGAIRWEAKVLAPGSAEVVSANPGWETPHWARARVAAANRVRTPDGTVEGFLFYRGLGNFELPVRISSDHAGAVVVENIGRETIPFVLVYAHGAADVPVLTRAERDLAAGERRVLTPRAEKVSAEARLEGALMQEGLTYEETVAMLATWKESYFDAPGLRVFWVVPRVFTDAILPLKVTPEPSGIARVLVGRAEVLTPTFERELVAGFSEDSGARWWNDRYFLAYRERARQLGVVSRVGAP